jgi:hypothetical protein
MIRKRARFDAMAPVPEPTWLVISDDRQIPIGVHELAPNTDPRMVLIQQMARSIGKGWEVEELPGTIPIYFARKGDQRRCISIVRKRPDGNGLSKR